MLFTYTGERPAVLYRGVAFTKGEPTEVPAELVSRLKGRDDFEADDDLSDLTVDELEDRLGDRLDSVEGTGKNGNVLKADLIKALESDA